MTPAQRRGAIVVTALAAMGLAVFAVALFSLSFPAFGGASAWYFRARTFDIVTPALVLGALGYALPPTALASLALRVGAVLGLAGLAAEAVEFATSFGNAFSNTTGELGARTLAQLSDGVAYAAVLAAWWFVERRPEREPGLP